jgi:hypothetical protein
MMTTTHNTLALFDDDGRSKIERANAAFIKYPRIRAIHERILECQRLSRLAQEPQCMILEGVPGAGKSTLVRDYVQAFPTYRGPNGLIIPALYVETPSPVTVKGMASTMLQSIGDPLWHKGTQTAMDLRLQHYIKACEVEIIILDDFHHLIERHKPHTVRTVANWIKVLIKQTGRSFLMVCIEGTSDQILGDVDNRQLSRLFAVRETLAPFSWDIRDPATIKAFHQFLKRAECALDMPIHLTIPRINFLYRVHQATNGVVAHIMNLLRSAQMMAMKCERKTIWLDDFADAYTARLSYEVKRSKNPFHQKYTVPEGVANAQPILETD